MSRLLTRYGRPFPTMRAYVPAPSFELDLVEQSALGAIRRAGRAGLIVGLDMLVSTAIRLALLGLIVIDRGDPQRVRLRQGRV